MDFQHWLHEAVNILSESESPRREAEILLEFVTKKTCSFFLAFGETLLTIEQEDNLKKLLARRKIGEPIAYIIKKREFWSLPLNVSTATIIPRQDTECLVEQALLHLPDKPSRILDLGTGTGAIALALAKERPDCNVVAVDLIPDAVELARYNVEHLEIHNVYVLKSHWFSALYNQPFEMIVSNPPYIDIRDPHLSRGDVRFEPITALVSPNKGIADISHIILHAYKYLVPGGWLLLEHGWMQGRIVRQLLIKANFFCVETFCDYGGNERLTLGKTI